MTKPVRGRALRDAIEAELAAGRPDRKRRIARLKAEAVEAAWADHPGRGLDGTLDVRGVLVRAMRSVTAEDGTPVLEVYVDDPANGEPHYRIINPPSLVHDASGDIQVGDLLYREDPVGAVAQLLVRAGAGGKQAGTTRKAHR